MSLLEDSLKKDGIKIWDIIGKFNTYKEAAAKKKETLKLYELVKIRRQGSPEHEIFKVIGWNKPPKKQTKKKKKKTKKTKNG